LNRALNHPGLKLIFESATFAGIRNDARVVQKAMRGKEVLCAVKPGTQAARVDLQRPYSTVPGKKSRS